jgi:hypothetical protein
MSIVRRILDRMLRRRKAARQRSDASIYPMF